MGGRQELLNLCLGFKANTSISSSRRSIRNKIDNMQAYKPLFLGLSLICAAFSVHAQGSFGNLNFESAQIPSSTPPGYVSVATGLPGWTVYLFQPAFGVEPQSQVFYDGTSLGGAFVAINDANTGFGFAPLQGRFSAVLYGGEFEQ